MNARIKTVLMGLALLGAAQVVVPGQSLLIPFNSQFPAPDYDSGWVAMDPATFLTLQHGLGGDTDSYLVDFQQRSGASANHNCSVGVSQFNGLGAMYFDLGPSSLTLNRSNDAPGPGWEKLASTELRIRIWVTK